MNGAKNKSSSEKSAAGVGWLSLSLCWAFWKSSKELAYFPTGEFTFVFLDTNSVFSPCASSWWAIDVRHSHRPTQESRVCISLCVFGGRGSHHTQDTMEPPGLPQNAIESLIDAVLRHHPLFFYQPLPELLLGFLNDSSFLFSEKKIKSVLSCPHISVDPLGALSVLNTLQ